MTSFSPTHNVSIIQNSKQPGPDAPSEAFTNVPIKDEIHESPIRAQTELLESPTQNKEIMDVVSNIQTTLGQS